LFCLSSHYSKPLDYSDEAIIEMRNKWIQIENAYYELKYRIDNNITSSNKYSPFFDSVALRNECSAYFKEFENFIEDDLNFSNALTSFFKFVNKTNNIFSTVEADREILLFTNGLLEKFMFVLGLKINAVSDKEKDEIQGLMEKRNRFRKNKNYGESDRIRDVLLREFAVELIDHKDFTVWKKIL
jgi:cysteinyl-tRNA synthetase